MPSPFRAHYRLHFPVRPLVRRVDNAMAKPLSQAAGAIRLTARRSIRQRIARRNVDGAKVFSHDRGASRPGTPPRTYTGALKRSILYKVDKRDLTAVIGPSRELIGTVGATHEFGGKEKRRQANWNLTVGGFGPIAYNTTRVGETYGAGRRTRKRGALVVIKLKTNAEVRRAQRVAREYAARTPTKKLATYPKRPFMGPALDKNRATLPQHWRASVSP